MAGPFRISRAAPSQNQRSASTAEKTAAFQSYQDRLIRMIPGEVVAFYMVGAGVIPPDHPEVLAGWSVVCLLGLIAWRAKGSTDPQNAEGAQWSSVAISAAAFVVWLYSLGGPFAAYHIHVPYIGSLLVLAWTFFVPIFYKGE